MIQLPSWSLAEERSSWPLVLYRLTVQPARPISPENTSREPLPSRSSYTAPNALWIPVIGGGGTGSGSGAGSWHFLTWPGAVDRPVAVAFTLPRADAAAAGEFLHLLSS